MSSGDEDAPPPKPAASTSKPAMHQFLRTAGSDSSSSSSDDDDDDSDSDSDDGAKPKKPKSKLPRASDSEDEDSDEEGKPGIKILSATEKRLAEMEATGKVMENGLKINDWVVISTGEYMIQLVSSLAKLLSQNSTNLCA